MPEQYKIDKKRGSTLNGEIISQGDIEMGHPPVSRLDVSLFKNGMYIITFAPERHKKVSERLVIMNDY